MAKQTVSSSGELGWLSGLGLGLVERFLSFLARLFAGIRSAKISVPVPVR